MLGAGSLRCRIGWHRPRAGGRWHHGYCFTDCERCGRDMVRSAFGEWQVPKGFRVVANGDAAALAALDVALAARDGGTIAEVRSVSPPVSPPVSSLPASQPAARPSPVPVRSAAAGSPFDFADFDAIDSTAGASPAPPPRNRAWP